MTIFRNSVCFAALISASAAMAQVTPQEVWDDWKDQLGIYGDGFTIGSEEMSGNTLTVSDLGFAMSDDQGSVKGALASMVFTDLGNGSVAVSMSENNPLVITINNDGYSTTIRASINHEGLSMIVSGTPEELTYAVLAARYGIRIDEVITDGEAIDVVAEIGMNNLSGDYTSRKANLRHMNYDIRADSIDLKVRFMESGDGGGFITVNGSIADYSGNATIAMPLEADMNAPEEMFNNGFDFETNYSFGATNFDVDFVDDNDTLLGQLSSTGTSFSLALNKDAISYSTAATGLDLSVSTSELPFPIDLTLGAYGIGLTMPLSKSDEPADFGINMNITDLAISEAIWAMVPGGSSFPQDPATVAFDLTGTAKMLFDILDPAQSDALADSDMPAEIYSLNLNSLLVSAVGAQIVGDGAFTFNNADLETFNGFPAPVGELNVNIKGANGLMDKLVEIGLMPEEQILGFRMMMGLFANSVGDDELQSKIEVTEDGSVFANGQQLQ